MTFLILIKFISNNWHLFEGAIEDKLYYQVTLITANRVCEDHFCCFLMSFVKILRYQNLEADTWPISRAVSIILKPVEQTRRKLSLVRQANPDPYWTTKIWFSKEKACFISSGIWRSEGRPQQWLQKWDHTLQIDDNVRIYQAHIKLINHDCSTSATKMRDLEIFKNSKVLQFHTKSKPRLFQISRPKIGVNTQWWQLAKNSRVKGDIVILICGFSARKQFTDVVVWFPLMHSLSNIDRWCPLPGWSASHVMLLKSGFKSHHN